MKRNPVIATRGSKLALWQANFVKSMLEQKGISCELLIVKTKGDEITDISLEKAEGKGFFTKEIEEALISSRADIAVHSHKDLPTEVHPDLVIAAVPLREDPSELLLIRKDAVDEKKILSLKLNAKVGTSSSRRKSQLLAFRNDLDTSDLRGNVPTRIDKLRNGMYDAILIAAAGVERLELDTSDLHAVNLDPREFIPAPAQGALAIQVRKTDASLIEALQFLNDPQTASEVELERKILNLFNGGCHSPVAAFAQYDETKEVFTVRTCRDEAWDDVPVSVYAESKSVITAAEKAVEKIKQSKPSSVFITRNLRDQDTFRQVLTAKGFSVSGRSLIEMVPVPIRPFKETDWIFFSSKHAVKYFFSQHPVLGKQKFACVGKATAETLRRFGKRADFIGYSTDTKLTGKQFAARAGDGTVLFPQAKGSLRSVQNGFVSEKQVVNLVVYETLKRNEEEIPLTDIILFTSPSNVDAYFEKNKVLPSQKIIAMGEATASGLKKYGVHKAVLPDTFESMGLVRAVMMS